MSHPQTINQMFEEAAERGGKRSTAIIFYPRPLPYSYSLNYGRLWAFVWLFACGLKKLGVQKGDRVAFMLPNTPHAVIAYFAILKLGAIAVQFNPQYGPGEVERQLANCGARVFITLDLFRGVIEKMNHQPETVVLGSVGDFLPFPFNLLYFFKNPLLGNFAGRRNPALFFRKIFTWQPDAEFPEVSPEDIAVLQYTGGTTGISKGAVLTHGNLVANVRQLRHLVSDAREGEEVIMTTLPLFHSFAMTACQNFGVFINAALLLVPDPRDLNTLLSAIDKHRPTIFPGIPRLYMAINTFAEKKKKLDLSSIRFCVSGAAALPNAVLEKFEALTGGVLVEAFGLSEASPATHANPLNRQQRKVGSIGLPLDSTEAKIVDDNGVEAPAGESGELVISGPQVMQGYWQMPEETEKVLRFISGKKWLFTGDVAKKDRDGFFYIVDRKKDMINVGGENVFSLEVEEVLFQHPMVAEAAVVGERNKRGDEYVKAFVVLKDEGTEALPGIVQDIQSFCRERLAEFKVPKKIELVPEIPKTPIGKQDKKKLREIA